MNTMTEETTTAADLVEVAGFAYAVELLGLGEVLEASGLVVEPNNGGPTMSAHVAAEVRNMYWTGAAIFLNDAAKSLISQEIYSYWLDEDAHTFDLLVDGAPLLVVVYGLGNSDYDAEKVSADAVAVPVRLPDFRRSAGSAFIRKGSAVQVFEIV
jgi:hypothetical protein